MRHRIRGENAMKVNGEGGGRGRPPARPDGRTGAAHVHVCVCARKREGRKERVRSTVDDAYLITANRLSGPLNGRRLKFVCKI